MRRLAVAFVVFAALLPFASCAVWAQGSPTAAPAPPAGAVIAQSPYFGSVPGKLEPGVLQITLRDAMARGLKQNLGVLLSSDDIRAARGSRWQQLSTLLPNITTSSYWTGAQADLAEFGFSFKFPGAGSQFRLWWDHFPTSTRART